MVSVIDTFTAFVQKTLLNGSCDVVISEIHTGSFLTYILDIVSLIENHDIASQCREKEQPGFKVDSFITDKRML